MSISNLNNSNWNLFWLGVFVLLLGFIITATLAQHIAKYDGDLDFEYLTVGKSIKGGLMFTFFASFLIFFAYSMYFWIEHGFYQIGLAGIGSLILMILIAIEVSIRYQTGVVKKVLKDRGSIERIGTITHIEPHFYFQYFNRTKVVFYRLYVEINGVRSTTYIRNSNPLSKQLQEDDIVNVLINPKAPSYCAIINLHSC